MNNMIIGTHNSMSFLPPRHWWGYLAVPFGRCQKKNITEQYNSGARCFDIRIKLNCDYEFIFAHGLLNFRSKQTPYMVLSILNDIAETHNEKIYIRLILEDTAPHSQSEFDFKIFCRNIEKRFENLIFFGGNRKCDWKQIVKFQYEPKVQQVVGSMAADARWYEKLIPWFYAKRMNNKVVPDKNYDIIFYDFI